MIRTSNFTFDYIYELLNCTTELTSTDMIEKTILRPSEIINAVTELFAA